MAVLGCGFEGTSDLRLSSSDEESEWYRATSLSSDEVSLGTDRRCCPSLLLRCCCPFGRLRNCLWGSLPRISGLRGVVFREGKNFMLSSLVANDFDPLSSDPKFKELNEGGPPSGDVSFCTDSNHRSGLTPPTFVNGRFGSTVTSSNKPF